MFVLFAKFIKERIENNEVKLFFTIMRKSSEINRIFL